MESVEEKFRCLSIARRAKSEESMYILDVAQSTGLLAVSCSDFTIHIHDKNRLNLVGEYRGHRRRICGIAFDHTSPNLLFSGSADGTVRAWDLRQPWTDAVMQFMSDQQFRYCSFDLNCSSTLLCAGTQRVNGEDSFLIFWDVRQGGGVLGAYSESHSDDITHVHFHPQDEDRMASGSTDGLVNVFDLSQTTEEQALQVTCNSNSSTSSVCWSGADYNQLLCLGHDESLHLWDLSHLDTNEPLTVFSASDARSLTLLADGSGVEYLVGGSWLEKAQKLLVVGGKNSGDLHLMECDSSGLRLLSSLEGGHSSTVRCFLWDEVREALVTGGEDAQLLLWKPGGEALTVNKRESLKSESALKLESRPHKKPDYQREKKTA
ncbi:WD repeat-containing protein 89-like [Thalassophryne amazonica]|uniref:WD repeat-containing protein 89-like n=1 Tax=Thalassophryne amazonica TaxID=390379 RepID=UPI001470FB5B|nr:WD repeat-containing protein 89-like [Thalassophryne amazonica]XP_034015524.1 WD repeat-containing protein 89-like [Thalassophryne amazonica]